MAIDGRIADLGDTVQRRLSVSSLGHDPSVALENRTDVMARVGIVVHDQHGPFGLAEALHHLPETLPPHRLHDVIGGSK